MALIWLHPVNVRKTLLRFRKNAAGHHLTVRWHNSIGMNRMVQSEEPRPRCRGSTVEGAPTDEWTREPRRRSPEWLNSYLHLQVSLAGDSRPLPSQTHIVCLGVWMKPAMTDTGFGAAMDESWANMDGVRPPSWQHQHPSLIIGLFWNPPHPQSFS